MVNHNLSFTSVNAAGGVGEGGVLVDLFGFCLFVFSFHQQDVVDGIKTVKFVFITWVGENVKPMTKGKISTHKSTIEKAFHVSFVIKIILMLLTVHVYCLYSVCLSLLHGGS